MRCFLARHAVSPVFCALLMLSGSGCYQMNGYVMNRSGQMFYEQGNYVAAASEFQMAAMNDPTNPDYLANLARTRMKQGDLGGAEQIYRQALSVAPSHQPSYHGMSEVMMAQGRAHEAAGLLQTWAATQPYVAEAHVELAWLQREMGQPDAAVQSLQNALQVNPSHSTALAHLGQYYQDAGRPDMAISMYQSSLRTDWNQPDVHSRLALAAQQAGESHPMSATAMARGVNPYDIPRQQYAFGPPSQGAMMAQMQMQQQFAAASPWPAQGQTAWVPAPQQTAAVSQTWATPPGAAPSYHQVTGLSLTTGAAGMTAGASSGVTMPVVPRPVPPPSPDPQFQQIPLTVPASAESTAAGSDAIPSQDITSWTSASSSPAMTPASEVSLSRTDGPGTHAEADSGAPVLEAF